MDKMSLGQRVGEWLENYLADHSMLFILLICLMVAAANVYYRLFHVNRKTDNVDLMKSYTDLQMRRRYKL